ncbi:hypothetical protein V8G54_028443 [Vigna mungo]|uniref:Uncharacterized protein n=1 Tax=Vigna mungo TaxID=3915 RepID=A0AAQ3MS80_VIGMU
MVVRYEVAERRWWRGGWPDGRDNAGVAKVGQMGAVAVRWERPHDAFRGGDPNPRQVGVERDLKSLRCWSAEWGGEIRTPKVSELGREGRLGHCWAMTKNNKNITPFLFFTPVSAESHPFSLGLRPSLLSEANLVCTPLFFPFSLPSLI